MPRKNVFRLKIGGQAGQGVKSTGLTFAKFASRSGFQVYNYVEYPSLIRGGHNVMQINVSATGVTGPSKFTDFLVALNQDTVDKHAAELVPGAFVLFDSEAKTDTSKIIGGVNLLPVPLDKLAHDAGGKDLLINTVALGVLAGMLSGDLEVLIELAKQEYVDKPDVLKSDLAAINLGYQFALDNFSELSSPIFKLEKDKTRPMEKRLVLNGDEAVALGAISAGMQFAAIYPMSPISNILHTLAAHQLEYGYIYKQPEDEIAAINMAIGASYAGARSMTATSGGGFCLMTEGYGLAGMTETPLVIIEGMRAGPGTGFPTWSAQGDLQFVLHAHQDEFPRIVLAAGDVTEAFYMTMEAFYLADKYQTPVVVLIDKNICDDEESVPAFDISSYRVDRGKFTKELDPEYKRYQLNQNGISIRSVPGVGNFFIANSDEHDEKGYSNEETDNRNQQMTKRMKKLETCESEDMQQPLVFGPVDADLSIISWGSNKGSILQALKRFTNVNFLHIGWINPFPSEFVSKFLAKAKKSLLVECNYTSQLGTLIKEKTGFDIKEKALKFDGRPFFVEDIEDVIMSHLGLAEGEAR